MTGWYAVKRGITGHYLFKGKPDRLIVWMWLLDNAAWSDTTHDIKGKAVQVPRGSVCASERHIAEQCGIGYQVVRTAIKRFKDEHMINATPTHGKNIITLCNWGKYQNGETGPNALPSATLTQRQRNANAQKEQGNKVTREDTNVSSRDLPPQKSDEADEAIKHFNATAEQVGWPKVQKIDQRRKSALLGRMRDVGGLDGWRDAIDRAGKSPLLTGQNERGWKASFDWLTKPANFTKLMEGNYDPRNAGMAGSQTDNRRTSGPHHSLFSGFAAVANSGRGGTGGN